MLRLHVGHVRLLHPQMGSFGTWGVPSSDGRVLAFLEWSWTGNVWMVKESPESNVSSASGLAAPQPRNFPRRDGF